MKSRKEEAIASGEQSLRPELLKQFGLAYRKIMFIADRECPAPPEPGTKRRGRRKKGKERSLIERLISFEDSICLFAHDFLVPFDNNQCRTGCPQREDQGQGVRMLPFYAGCPELSDDHVVYQHRP
jgi:hypothetical protein